MLSIGTKSSTLDDLERPIRTLLQKRCVWSPCKKLLINDLPEVCKESNNIFLHADDAKFYRHVKTQSDN